MTKRNLIKKQAKSISIGEQLEQSKKKQIYLIQYHQKLLSLQKYIVSHSQRSFLHNKSEPCSLNEKLDKQPVYNSHLSTLLLLMTSTTDFPGDAGGFGGFWGEK